MNWHTHLVASPIVGSIFGGVLALGAFPNFIFQLIALLEGKEGGILPEAQVPSLVTAGVLAVLSLMMLTWRHRVTADPKAHTITWTHHTLGFSWTSATWKRDDILAIDVGHAGYGHRTWYVLARAAKRRKVIYERAGIPEPTGIANTMASSVRRRVVRFESLPSRWWKTEPAKNPAPPN